MTEALTVDTALTLEATGSYLHPSGGTSGSGAGGAEPTGGLSDLAQLWTLLQGFAPTEIRAVLFVARRLAMGRKKYGVLDPTNTKTACSDWLEMAQEELADMFCYMAAEEMRREMRIEALERLARGESLTA